MVYQTSNKTKIDTEKIKSWLNQKLNTTEIILLKQE